MKYRTLWPRDPFFGVFGIYEVTRLKGAAGRCLCKHEDHEHRPRLETNSQSIWSSW